MLEYIEVKGEFKELSVYRFPAAISQRVYETISFTEKMKSIETLAVVVSMGRVINENILISDGSDLIGVDHFPNRPYDDKSGCMCTKLCSRMSPDHLRLSLTDRNESVGNPLMYIIYLN